MNLWWKIKNSKQTKKSWYDGSVVCLILKFCHFFFFNHANNLLKVDQTQ